MNTSPLELTHEMQAEIERHKYFLSESAGHDVGWEFAEQDWDENYAVAYRRAKTPESGGLGGLVSRLLARARSH